MNDFVNIISSDSRFGFPRSNVQHLSGEPANLAHSLLFLLIQDLDPVPSNENLLRVWNSIFSIIGKRDVLGYLPPWRQRVYRSQSAGKWECGKRIEVTSVWIGFRNHFRWEEITERVTLCLVQQLMLALEELVSMRSDVPESDSWILPSFF